MKKIHKKFFLCVGMLLMSASLFAGRGEGGEGSQKSLRSKIRTYAKESVEKQERGLARAKLYLADIDERDALDNNANTLKTTIAANYQNAEQREVFVILSTKRDEYINTDKAFRKAAQPLDADTTYFVLIKKEGKNEYNGFSTMGSAKLKTNSPSSTAGRTLFHTLSPVRIPISPLLNLANASQTEEFIDRRFDHMIGQDIDKGVENLTERTTFVTYILPLAGITIFRLADRIFSKDSSISSLAFIKKEDLLQASLQKNSQLSALVMNNSDLKLDQSRIQVSPLLLRVLEQFSGSNQPVIFNSIVSPERSPFIEELRSTPTANRTSYFLPFFTKGNTLYAVLKLNDDFSVTDFTAATQANDTPLITAARAARQVAPTLFGIPQNEDTIQKIADLIGSKNPEVVILTEGNMTHATYLTSLDKQPQIKNDLIFVEWNSLLKAAVDGKPISATNTLANNNKNPVNISQSLAKRLRGYAREQSSDVTIHQADNLDKTVLRYSPNAAGEIALQQMIKAQEKLAKDEILSITLSVLVQPDNTTFTFITNDTLQTAATTKEEIKKEDSITVETLYQKAAQAYVATINKNETEIPKITSLFNASNNACKKIVLATIVPDRMYHLLFIITPPQALLPDAALSQTHLITTVRDALNERGGGDPYEHALAEILYTYFANAECQNAATKICAFNYKRTVDEASLETFDAGEFNGEAVIPQERISSVIPCFTTGTGTLPAGLKPHTRYAILPAPTNKIYTPEGYGYGSQHVAKLAFSKAIVCNPINNVIETGEHPRYAAGKALFQVKLDPAAAQAGDLAKALALKDPLKTADILSKPIKNYDIIGYRDKMNNEGTIPSSMITYQLKLDDGKIMENLRDANNPFKNVALIPWENLKKEILACRGAGTLWRPVQRLRQDRLGPVKGSIYLNATGNPEKIAVYVPYQMCTAMHAHFRKETPSKWRRVLGKPKAAPAEAGVINIYHR